ncbi:GNAT family N-acetyltransferase [Roseomonas sp. CCTCC AB2023176]|uniref:GNAT family N-acetyltransferase n=1 Tax=Roseomonas sp. CCTCC AB2023176 TaxID=3342640 RepID=UPI0035D5CDA5
MTIRRPTEADGPALIAAHRAGRELHHPWIHPFTDEAGFDAWRERALTGNFLGLIVEAEEGIAGIVNISNIVLGAFRNATLGYWAMPGMTGRGYLSEGVRQVAMLAFTELGLHRLEANIQPGNAPSLGVARRAGFRKEGFSPRMLHIAGEWRDHERWARLAEYPAPR